MDVRRIFLALDISDAARAACVAHIDSLRQRSHGVRVGWERPEKLHITLKFLGDTSGDSLERLQYRISSIASALPAFRLSLAASGVFPSRSRPRILWIGITDTSDATAMLHSRVEEACADLGFEKEKKRFHPHITIGRIRDTQAASRIAGDHLQMEIEPVEFEVAEIVIYESKLKPTGSVYSKVASFPFSD